ncbi:exocyst complex component SEC3A [Vigna radiata var. radiata]|uniref:Exocyst complex component SEC3A n=1 Tax=Vigna radiata var. radiata TaxID=3916 RepID=A0A3Q0EY76_VIGRR|nr:exocyst complex component SEC3A [Vigna radiata var. radiata]XP_022636715.1 exocyst complex component SEC3A [Vigna radiata var. radiata]
MAKSSADDAELRRACQLAVEGTKHKVVLCIRTVKTHGTWGKSAKVRQMAKPRVLVLCTKAKGQRTKAFLRVLKYSTGGVLEPAKLYKLKHLSKMEVVTNDPSGCTFTLGFDNLRSQSVAPSQWTMRNTDDRNRFLLCILNICKDVLGRLPKVVGIDVVEMALWAKENTPAVSAQSNQHGDASIASSVTESELKVYVEKELVSQAEEEDIEALLGTYIMGVGEAEAFSERLKRELQALEAANVHAILESEPLIDEVLHGLESATNSLEDMNEWLAMFNVKLRHMREDIESIETRNNKLEMQNVNNRSLIEELDKLLQQLSIPSEYSACLTGDSFDEAQMQQNIEACEWLTTAMRGLEVPNIDPTYAKMRGVKEKRGELQIIKSTFVGKASEYMRNYFATFVDFMLNDKNYFSQRGQLKRPDHADLRFKCRTYARLLKHLKILDKNCLGPLRKAYCSSLNLLLRKEAREFANELRAGVKTSKTPSVWLEVFTGSGQNVNPADTATVSEAYAKMLTIFIPLLVDESLFFAHFMCFEVPSAVDGNKTTHNDEDDDGIASGKVAVDLAALNESLQDLLDGIQEDFGSVVDWAYKIDPLCCISMHGTTERYLSGQKADAAGYVRVLLDDLEARISFQFGRFVDDACHQIERNERNARQTGVLPYIPRFAALATRMEQFVAGQSRDLVDQAYTKFVSIMFVTLEKNAQADPKYADIFLIENYAAFQNSLYDLANVVPTLAKFYHQASEAYEQACTRHISVIIYYQFERLFQFARKIEDLILNNVAPEEIPFQVGLSKADLRKTLKSSLSGVDKSIAAMYKKLQKNLTSEELLPSLWDKCKKDFLDKYETFVQLVAKIYPAESVPSVGELRDLLASM